MAERARTNGTRGLLGPRGKAGQQPAWRLAQSSAVRVADLSEAHPARQSHHQHGPDLSPEPTWQPPAAPAATEVASLHLARWAPHPSAETAPGTEPSPRTPALVTLPPRQKLVEEATSVKAVTPAADPSSLPVAETFGRRAAAPRTSAWAPVQASSFSVVVGNNEPGLITRPVRAVPPWGGEPPSHRPRPPQALEPALQPRLVAKRLGLR